MAQDDIIPPEKAKQLRLDALKPLKETTTDVKATISVLKDFVTRNLLPEEDFNDAKCQIADTIADSLYQARVYVTISVPAAAAASLIHQS